MSDIPVIILCGGRGMRLGERTESVPKPLVEIGGKPILWHVMQIYAKAGFRRFILCLGYRGVQIRQYFYDLLDWRGRDFTIRGEGVDYHACDIGDWEITFVDTGALTETGGRLQQIEKYVQTPTFFVSYADGVSDISIPSLLKAHTKSGLVGTMTCVRPHTHYGIAEIAKGKVASYEEKPQLGVRVNGGFFCFEREVFRYLDDGPLEKGPLQKLVSEKQLGAYVHDGFWACMDNAKDHQYLNDICAQKQALW